MKDGTKIEDEISVADAHPAGSRPFERSNYIEKFQTLTQGIITTNESDRFLKAVQNLRKLKSGELTKLTLKLKEIIENQKQKSYFLIDSLNI